MEITITIKIDDETLKGMFADQVAETKCKKPEKNEQISPSSSYAVHFDENSMAWSKDPELNKIFLLQQQTYANEKLKTKGYLFLNEVYDVLGLPRTKAGQVIGWVYDEDNPIGDNYVDFDIFARHNRHFVNGRDNVVLLDFNVDGIILDYI